MLMVIIMLHGVGKQVVQQLQIMMGTASGSVSANPEAGFSIVYLYWSGVTLQRSWIRKKT